METNPGSETTSGVEPHNAARPMKVVVDENGCAWLCDRNTDERGDLRKKGRWDCGEVAFTRDS